MISYKLYKGDSTTSRFLSDFLIRGEQFARPYCYIFDDTLDPSGSEDVLQDDQSVWNYPDNLYKRGADIPQSEDLVTVEKWSVVDNSILFYLSPLTDTSVWVEVATTAEEFGSTLTQPSVERAEAAANEAAQSAVEAEAAKTDIELVIPNPVIAQDEGLALVAHVAGNEWEEIKSQDVGYDNTVSGLSATNVKSALDEIVTETVIVGGDNVFTGSNTFSQPIKTDSITNMAGTCGVDVCDIASPTGSGWAGTVLADEQALRDFYGDQTITVAGANFSVKSYPDGSVVGSTDNGEFKMCANGDLKVVSKVDKTVWDVSVAWGTGLFADETASGVTYPIVFINDVVPLMSVHHTGAATCLTLQWSSSTIAKTGWDGVSLLRGTVNNNVTASVWLTSDGRWKV